MRKEDKLTYALVAGGMVVWVMFIVAMIDLL